MFQHSIKVPQLYKSAAKIVKEFQENGTNVKSQIFNTRHPNKKGIYAIVVDTIKRHNDINYILNKSKLLTKERLDEFLARVLITELIWGKNKLSGESKPIKTILAYEQTFKAHLSDIEDKSSNDEEKVNCNNGRPKRG